MPPHREGGQVQYRAEEGDRPVVSLGEVLDWATDHLAEPITIDDLAARINVSPRTLARRFADQLGIAPGHWLLAQRIARTRVLLEETDLPVETIAARVGLSSATNLRRRFHAALHTTPSAYRRAYQGR